MMRLSQVTLRFGLGLLLVSPVMAFMAGSHLSEAKLAAQTANRAPQLPVVDEYYPVKNDWIAQDRSLLTIKHQPTGLCYVLLYPAGNMLMPVDKEQCVTPPAER